MSGAFRISGPVDSLLRNRCNNSAGEMGRMPVDAELQAMLDHFRIRKVLAAYCHGCDRCDSELMASVYAKDSWDDHGAIKAPGPEFVTAIMQSIREDTETLSHLLGQSIINVDGDRAGAETCFLAVTRQPGTDGEPVCSQLGGRFVDRLAREDGEWKIKHRVVLRDWSVSIPIVNDWDDSTALTSGERWGKDLSASVISFR